MPWFGGDAIYGALTALNNREQKSVCTQPTAQPPAATLPSSGFGPLPPWVGQRHHHLMAPPLPMGPCKERAIGLGGDAVDLLVLGAKTQSIKKQRGGRGLCLRWPPINQDTQQSTQSRRQR
jgi:hypothetical protein